MAKDIHAEQLLLRAPSQTGQRLEHIELISSKCNGSSSAATRQLSSEKQLWDVTTKAANQLALEQTTTMKMSKRTTAIITHTEHIYTKYTPVARLRRHLPPAIPLLQLDGLGSAVSSPNGIRGKAPAANAFLCITSPKIASGDVVSGHFCSCFLVPSDVGRRGGAWSKHRTPLATGLKKFGAFSYRQDKLNGRAESLSLADVSRWNLQTESEKLHQRMNECTQCSPYALLLRTPTRSHVNNWAIQKIFSNSEITRKKSHC